MLGKLVQPKKKNNKSINKAYLNIVAKLSNPTQPPQINKFGIKIAFSI